MGLNFGQNLFPARGEPISSYDYFDIADGTGYIRYYGFRNDSSTGTTYGLTTTQPDGYTPKTRTAYVDDTTFTKQIDADFDLSPFNLPKTIEGTGIVNGAVLHEPGSGTQQYYIIARIRKWDGTTETEIASKQSPTETEDTDNNTTQFCLNLTIPQTHYKAGETLRVTIEVWGINSQASNYRLNLYHSPRENLTPTTTAPGSKEADEYAYSSRLIVYIPYKLNI